MAELTSWSQRRLAMGVLSPWRDERVRPIAAAGAIGAWTTVAAGSLLRPGPSPSIFWFGAEATSPTATWICTLVIGLATVLSVVAWAALASVVRRRPVAVRTVAWTTVWWAAPFAIGPPLFSHDIFSYAAQGELVARGLDPYRFGPAALGRGAFLDPVSHLWRHTTAPYGPLWLRTAGVLAVASGHHPAVLVLLLHLLAVGCVAATGWLVVRLARRLGRDPSLVLAIALGSPLVLLHLVSGAHNEAMMIALLVGGLVLLQDRQLVLGVIAIAAAASIKAPAALGLVFVGWALPVPPAPRLRQAAAATATLVGGVFAMAAIAAATGLGWGWVHALTNPGRVRPLESPFGAAGIAVASAGRALGLVDSGGTIATAAMMLGLVVGAAGIVIILLRSHDRVPVVSFGLAWGVAMLCGPALYPWYLAAPLALMAFARQPWRRTAAMGVATFFSLVTLPTGVGLLPDLGILGLWVVPVLSAAGAVWWWRRHDLEQQLPEVRVSG